MRKKKGSHHGFTVIDRFLQKIKVNQENRCWEWIASCNKQGYGFFKFENISGYAHRASYRIYIGEIPNNGVVMHKCDNPCCVNPFHLELGTYKSNNVDMFLKGRSNRESKHGTRHMYNTFKCKCDLCRTAHIVYQRIMRHNRKLRRELN